MAGQVIDWIRCKELWVPPRHSKIGCIYIHAHGEDPSKNRPRKPMPKSEWHTIDLAPYGIPKRTKAVFLAPIFVTQGSGVPADRPPQYTSMTFTARKPGCTELTGMDYLAAAVASMPGGAFRQNAALWVPVKDRTFEFFWYWHEPDAELILNVLLQAAAA
jgi:hypothetical protein